MVQPLEDETIQPINIFFSYAHEDEDLVKRVQKQLCVYKRLLRISPWYDREILPGADWESEIDERLRSAHIILLFVSPDFMASDYCYGVELREALHKEDVGEARVIPIILRPCEWKIVFGRLQALPTDGRAITQWGNRDQVCLDVAHGIMEVVNAMDSSA